MVHDLKSWPIYFNAVISGIKTFETRLDDGRGFAAGDSLRLKEWDPVLEIYTGRELRVLVKYAMELDLAKIGVVSWPIVTMSIERI
jgi:ribosomal protein L16/L10AE